MFNALGLVAVTHLTSMAPMNVGAGIAAVWILWRRKKMWSKWIQQPVVIAYLRVTGLLFFAAVWSLVAAWIWPATIGGKMLPIRPEVLLKFWYFLLPLFWGLEWHALQSGEKEKITRIYHAALGGLSVFAILQVWIGWYNPQRIPGWENHFHATALLGHHLSLASVWPFATFAALAAGSLHGRLFGCLGSITVFLSFARSVWVAFPLGVAVWGLPRISREKRGQIMGLSVLTGLALLLVAPVRRRLFALYGLGPRMDLWEANWHFFKERWLVGVGFRHNESLSGLYLQAKYHTDDVFAGHAHNNFLEMLGGTGLLGFAAWAAWNLWLIRLLVKMRAVPWAWAYACALLVFHLNGLTQVNFWEGKVMHSLMWVTGWALAASTQFVDRRRPAGL